MCLISVPNLKDQEKVVLSWFKVIVLNPCEEEKCEGNKLAITLLLSYANHYIVTELIATISVK